MSPQILEFDELSHTYRIGGRVIDSVTQVLTKAGLIDTQWFTEEGKIRGNAVHKAIFYDLQNDLNWARLHPVIKPYVEAWREFRTKTRLIPIFFEKRVYNPIHDYTGTLDLLCKINGRNWLIDYKTGDSRHAHWQTAGYKYTPEILPYLPNRATLKLNNNGSFKFIEHPNDSGDFAEFINALRSVKEFENVFSKIFDNKF